MKGQQEREIILNKSIKLALVQTLQIFWSWVSWACFPMRRAIASHLLLVPASRRPEVFDGNMMQHATFNSQILQALEAPTCLMKANHSYQHTDRLWGAARCWNHSGTDHIWARLSMFMSAPAWKLSSSPGRHPDETTWDNPSWGGAELPESARKPVAVWTEKPALKI